MAALDDYLALITSAHNQKPKYLEMLETLGSPLVDGQARALALNVAYDIDQATGARLDVLGKWIGLSRTLPAPIEGVYFAWNTAGVGWNEGVWKGPFDPDTGLVTLDDETYRVFLKSKIAVNNWDGRGATWRDLMAFAFSGTGTVIDLVDKQDMSIDVVISGTQPTKLMLELIKRGYLSVKPCGVRINAIYTSSVDGAPIFAWNAGETATFGGWNSGTWAITV